MLDICQRFVAKYSLQFSTDPNPVKSKTKCIFGYGPARSMQKPVNLCSDGKQLPLVESALHLGHLPSYRNDLNDKWTIPGSSWFPLFPYLNNISRIVVANLFPILLAMSYLLIAVCTCESYFANLAPCFLVKSFETIKF